MTNAVIESYAVLVREGRIAIESVPVRYLAQVEQRLAEIASLTMLEEEGESRVD